MYQDAAILFDSRDWLDEREKSPGRTRLSEMQHGPSNRKSTSLKGLGTLQGFPLSGLQKPRSCFAMWWWSGLVAVILERTLLNQQLLFLQSSQRACYTEEISFCFVPEHMQLLTFPESLHFGSHSFIDQLLDCLLCTRHFSRQWGSTNKTHTCCLISSLWVWHIWTISYFLRPPYSDLPFPFPSVKKTRLAPGTPSWGRAPGLP